MKLPKSFLEFGDFLIYPSTTSGDIILTTRATKAYLFTQLKPKDIKQLKDFLKYYTKETN